MIKRNRRREQALAELESRLRVKADRADDAPPEVIALARWIIAVLGAGDDELGRERMTAWTKLHNAKAAGRDLTAGQAEYLEACNIAIDALEHVDDLLERAPKVAVPYVHPPVIYGAPAAEREPCQAVPPGAGFRLEPEAEHLARAFAEFMDGRAAP